MSLDKFRLPETPESRTYRVVLLLIGGGLVTAVARGGWQLLAGAPFGEEMIGLTAAAAVAYALTRYLRQRQRTSAGRDKVPASLDK